MRYLTRKEEEIMQLYWAHGPMSIKRLQELYDEPQPHVNTLSTIVRGLEEKGCIGHEQKGKTFVYHAAASADEIGTRTVRNAVERYFRGSFSGLVSTLVKEEEVSVDELRRLLDEIESSHNS